MPASDNDGRQVRRMTPKLYERALLLYREHPGRHARVAAALSTGLKVCTAAQVKRLYEAGLPDYSLPPIADALRGEVRALLGGEAGYDLKTGDPVEAPVSPVDAPEVRAAASACLNSISPKERRRLRQRAADAAAREATVQSELEVRRIEAEAKRAEAQAAAAREQAEAERAKAERIRAEASVGARAASAGLANPAELSLVERRAQEAALVGGMRDQVRAGSAVLKAVLFTLANKGQDVVTALKAEDMTPDEYTRMTRRVVSTVKDLAEVADKTVKLERLIFGEPTEHIAVETVGGENPLDVLMSGIEALRRATERGAIDVTAEDGDRLAALTGSVS